MQPLQRSSPTPVQVESVIAWTVASDYKYASGITSPGYPVTTNPIPEIRASQSRTISYGGQGGDGMKRSTQRWLQRDSIRQMTKNAGAKEMKIIFSISAMRVGVSWLTEVEQDEPFP